MKRFLASHYLLALFPTIIVALLLPKVSKHYSIEVLEKKYDPKISATYSDLNGDGETELIYLRLSEPLNSMLVMNNDGKFHEQWNTSDSFIPDSRPFMGDFDHDSKNEIYVFTAHADSIFLTVNEFFEPQGTHLHRIFIAKANLVDGKNLVSVKPFALFDRNGDGYKELYFGITTGFGLWPRMIYSFDIITKKFLQTPFTGVNLSDPSMEDLDHDGLPEIYSMYMSASGNYHTPTPYPDYSAWLMVFDDKLKFKFPPPEFSGFGGSLDIFPLRNDSTLNIAAMYNYQGAETPKNAPGLYLYTHEGILIKYVDTGTSQRLTKSMAIRSHAGDQLVLLSNPLLIYGSDLHLLRKVDIPMKENFKGHIVDIDLDGNEELLLSATDEERILVLNADFEILFDENIFIPFSTEWEISYVRTMNESKVFIKSGDKAFFIWKQENSNFIFSYLIYPAIYFGFLSIIWLTQKITTYQLEKKEMLNKRLLTLQLQSIKGQLEPHFTFNAFNTMSSMIYLDDRKAAYDAMGLFSKILRQFLNDADRVYRTLREEIDFVKNYMELENIRFNKKLSFNLIVEEGVTLNELIPKLVLQSYAENAIKHGLLPKGGGQLKITIAKKVGYLVLTVSDNGIGRQESRKLNSKSIGKGIKINTEFFDILNQINDRPILQRVEDLVDENNKPSGTMVEIQIPV